MMTSLRNARVAVLEGRRASELAELVRTHGGDPISAPALREVPLGRSDEVASFIGRLIDGACQVAVFLTGAGAILLFQAAEALRRMPDLRQALQRMTTVCRGPKPSAALRQAGVQVSLAAREPYTTTELLDAMGALDLAGVGVALLHYGEPSTGLAQALRDRGARLEELQIYEWSLPEDLGPLKGLVTELVAGRVDAIVFTSQVQVRHLFQVAAEDGRTDALAGALRSGTVVASVGPICSAVLASFGVTPHVAPARPKMHPLVDALAAYLEQHRTPAG